MCLSTCLADFTLLPHYTNPDRFHHTIHQSSIGRFRAGCQPQKEIQQEKKEGMFHLEILCL